MRIYEGETDAALNQREIDRASYHLASRRQFLLPDLNAGSVEQLLETLELRLARKAAEVN